MQIEPVQQDRKPNCKGEDTDAKSEIEETTDGCRRGPVCQERRAQEVVAQGPSKGMYESMSKTKLEEMAGTKRKKLPQKERS